MGLTPEKRLNTKFRKRLRRRLCYGDMADLDAPSLPLTELAVDYFHDSAPGKLGHVDLEGASNIVKENKVTPCSMVVSVLYARRLRQRSKQYLETMSSSDVFFISMMMASKYMYDEGTDDEVYNDEWAVSVDQDVCDVNKMEMDFLEAMDWRLFVRPEEFEEALDAIENRLALQEGLKRGWFTYSELDVLMKPDLIVSLWSGVGAELSKLLATLSAAYLTGVLSMLGSVVLATQVAVPLSSATVALMALHTPPSVSDLSPLTSDPGSSVQPIPGQSFRNCRALGVAGECLESMDSEDGGLPVGLDPDDLNKTSVISRGSAATSYARHDGIWQAKLLHGEGQGLAEDGSADGERGGNGFQGESEGNSDDGEGLKEDVRSEGCEREDGEGKMDKDPTVPSLPRPITSSLWSLWFVDSLLSQLWSLISTKSQSTSSKASFTSTRSFRERPGSATAHRVADTVDDQDTEASLESPLGLSFDADGSPLLFCTGPNCGQATCCGCCRLHCRNERKSVGRDAVPSCTTCGRKEGTFHGRLSNLAHSSASKVFCHPCKDGANKLTPGPSDSRISLSSLSSVLAWRSGEAGLDNSSYKKLLYLHSRQHQQDQCSTSSRVGSATCHTLSSTPDPFNCLYDPACCGSQSSQHGISDHIFSNHQPKPGLLDGPVSLFTEVYRTLYVA